jgi:gamma-glutamyltranspeptidase/glutathione hydrolase
MRGAVAAGHPLTAEAGARVLAAGGNAVDASQVFRIGAASVAAPGSTAGLEAAHRAYGSLPWRRLVEPALELARGGFEMTPEQAHLHLILGPILRRTDEGRRVYGRGGGSLRAGARVRRDDLAQTLELIAAEGAAAFYRGDLAAAIVAHVRDAGGTLTRNDLDAYRVIRRRPVLARYRGHDVLSNPPPSSGGVLIAYGLGLLDRLGEHEAGSAEAIARLVEIAREQARARNAPEFGRDLVRGGLARRLLADAAVRAAVARIRRRLAAPAEAAAAGGTTHVSVVDAAGNAASLSSSIGSGSGVVVPGTGVHLNNMLGEHDLVLAGAGARPGSRLTSMMAPSIVLRDRRPRLVVGSAGSARLRGAILQAVVNVVGHGLGVREAIERPRVHAEDAVVHCEGGHGAAELDRLEAWGYELARWRERNLFFGGVSAVEIRADGSLAAAGDPRRGGHGTVVA